MGKSIFMAIPGELVIRKSDGKHFEFIGKAPNSASSMILVRDPFDDDSVILKVSGMDFSVMVIGETEDRAETYDIPGNHAIDLIASEVVRLKEKIEQMHYNSADGWTESDQDQLERTQEKLHDCENAIKWIYGQII